MVREWVQELDVDLVAQAAVEMAERKFRQYQDGTDGLGGGCGGGFYSAPSSNIRGGNGVVIIRRVTADSDSASGGTVTTDGSDTIHTFNASGTYTG